MIDELTKVANEAYHEIVSIALSRSAPEELPLVGPVDGEKRADARQRRLMNVIRLAGDAPKTASALDFLKRPEVIAGLGGAAAGAGLTAMGPRRRGEGAGKKTLRVLRNSALTGVLGAGATAALRYGKDKLVDSPLPASDVDPVTQKVQDPITRSILAAAGLGGAFKLSPSSAKLPAHDDVIRDLRHHLTTQNPMAPGARSQNAQTILEQLHKSPDVSDSATKLRAAFGGKGVGNAEEILRTLGEPGSAGAGNTANLKKLLRQAGINYGTGLHGVGVGAQMGAEKSLMHLRSPGNIVKGLAGAGAGYFAPDIISSLAGQFGSGDSN